jgi:hypothetical protein
MRAALPYSRMSWPECCFRDATASGTWPRMMVVLVQSAVARAVAQSIAAAARRVPWGAGAVSAGCPGEAAGKLRAG